MALFWVILKPCRASRAAPACTSLSNSTKAMSCRPGTSRTSLKPGNLRDGQRPQESRLSTSPQLSGILGVGARNVAKHPTMQRTAPITKNYPAPNVYDAKLINSNIKKCTKETYHLNKTVNMNTCATITSVKTKNTASSPPSTSSPNLRNQPLRKLPPSRLSWSAVSFISLFSFLTSFPIRQPSSCLLVIPFSMSILRKYALFCGHGI